MAAIYGSLFNGDSKPLSKEQQKEYDKFTRQAQKLVDAMTDEQKLEEFAKLMSDTTN